MHEQEIHLHFVEHIIIKFLTIEGIKPDKIIGRLGAQFGKTCLKKCPVYEWYNKFLVG
jgi:hypothetical protein